ARSSEWSKRCEGASNLEPRASKLSAVDAIFRTSLKKQSDAIDKRSGARFVDSPARAGDFVAQERLSEGSRAQCHLQRLRIKTLRSIVQGREATTSKLTAPFESGGRSS